MGNCSKALNKEIVEADPTNFVCPECGKKLQPVTTTPPPPIRLILVIVGIIAIIGASFYGFKRCGSENDTTNVVVQPGPEPGIGTPIPEPGTTDPGVDTTDTTVTQTGPKGPDTPSVATPKEPTVKSRSVFGGAATMSANGTIKFRRSYSIDLKTMDDDMLHLNAGDEIRNVKIINGCLVSGEVYTKGGNERYVSGINERL